MKVYDWKTLTITILLGGMGLISGLQNIRTGEGFAILPIIFWGYLVIKGFWVSFSEERFEEDKLMTSINKKVLRELFGPWHFIAPYGGLILIIFAAIIFRFISSLKALSILLVIVGLIYQVLGSILVRKLSHLEKMFIFSSGFREHSSKETCEDGEKLLDLLNKKLYEELGEYNESGEVEELADLVEVVEAILDYKRVSKEEFNKIKEDKNRTRGSFKKGLLLLEVKEEWG